jgi:Condensation domain
MSSAAANIAGRSVVTPGTQEFTVEPGGGPGSTGRRHPDRVRVPDYLRAWWAELGINTVTANAPHVLWRVRGLGCASRFREAVRNAVARHDVLTRTVVRDGGVLYLERAPRWEIIECSSAEVSNAADQDEGAQLHRTIYSLVWTPFAEDAVVFRPFVIELSATDAVCGFVVHHRVVDYYGSQILAREICEEMLGAASKRVPEARAFPQFAEFLQGMADWVTGPEAVRRLEYWRNCMRDAQQTCLPNAASVDAAAVGLFTYIDFELSATLRSRLAGVARLCRSTLSLVTMAAHHIALVAESGQRDVVANVVVSGRDSPALLNMVGYTADCFPLRAVVNPSATFASFVQEMQRKFTLASRNRVKWELVELIMKDLRASTVAPVFNFHVAGRESAVASNPADGRETQVSFEPLQVDGPTELGSASFNMSHGLTLIDTGQIVRAHVRYLQMRHDRGTVESFLDRFLKCLTAIGLDPFAPVADIMEGTPARLQ